MLSMAAKNLALNVKYLWALKTLRQRPNVEAMKKNGAEIVPVNLEAKLWWML